MDLKSKEQLTWERPLIERAQGGDDLAFSELYRAYAPLVFRRVLLPKLGRPDAAEDALAETFRKGYEKLGTFETKDVSIYYWFARIASNKALDMHRARQRSSRALSNFETMLVPLMSVPKAPDAALDAQVDSEVLSQRITAVLENIHPRYRRAIELRFLQEMGRVECAEAMEVKVGTFDVLVLRALKAFRKEWEASGE